MKCLSVRILASLCLRLCMLPITNTSSVDLVLPIDIHSVKGFLDADEGKSLFEQAIIAASMGPLLEVGSYCGKSSVYLGTAAKREHTVLFAVDHHRGSEEHQLGEE